MMTLKNYITTGFAGLSAVVALGCATSPTGEPLAARTELFGTVSGPTGTPVPGAVIVPDHSVPACSQSLCDPADPLTAGPDGRFHGVITFGLGNSTGSVYVLHVHAPSGTGLADSVVAFQPNLSYAEPFPATEVSISLRSAP
jgi:hypothetical protein